MDTNRERIVVIPRISLPLAHANLETGLESEPTRRELPIVWVQDSRNFRLDITLPENAELEILFPLSVERLHVNGETVWSGGKACQSLLPNTSTQITQDGFSFVSAFGGALHIFAHIAEKGEAMRSNV